MAPGGAICLLVDGAGRSERFSGIDRQRELPGRALIAPSALDLGAVGDPELLAQKFQALPQREGLFGRPGRRRRERGSRSR